MEQIKKYEQCSLDELPEELDDLLSIYSPVSFETGDFHTIIEKGMEIFQIQDIISEEEFEKRFNEKLLKVASLHHVFAMHGMFTELDDEELSKKYLVDFNRIFELLYYWNHYFNSLIKMKKRTDPRFDGQIDTSLGLSRFEPIDLDSYTPYQSLIQYLMFKLREKGYRRQNDQCMKRIYTKEGYDTHAWEPIMEIKTFIMRETQRDVNRQQFLNLTKNPSNKRSAEEYLKEMEDPIYFPDVKTDRKLFSFENGIYETAIYDPDTGRYVDKWYPYVKCDGIDQTALSVPTHRSACNYFTQEFNYQEHQDWYSIETPHCQSILDYQKFPEDVCRIMYVFIGRLLYEVGELDNWQVMPFLLGKAKSGKSTILTQIVARFFPKEKLGNLSNNAETKFGLAALVDKYVFIGPEIKANLGLEQAEFQQIISGEDTQVNTKFKTASSVRWNVPGIIAGNQPPGYQDNQGSIARRLIIFDFINKVKNGDTKLGFKLEKEIPNLIFKCNRAYLEAVNNYGDKDIWKVIPKYFEKTRDVMAEQINSLVNFLNGDQVVYDKDLKVPKSEFAKAFKAYCSSNSLAMPSFTKQFYQGPFEDKDLYIKKSKLNHNGRNKSCDWIFGCDLMINVDNRNAAMQQQDQDDLDKIN